MIRPPSVIVRATRPGEGRFIAALWRELWDVHETWGGYPGSRDPRVYAQLAARLDDDARVRAGHPALGRHVHLVAEVDGALCGQVEGWLDHHGIDSSTPAACDVRSLIVSARARGAGVGRALLLALGAVARSAANHPSCVLAAEVLEPNPAQAFYARVGYAPVSWSARISGDCPSNRARGDVVARPAVPNDALALARFEATLAGRRRAAGDVRFDRPRAIDATVVSAIAAHLAGETAHDPSTLVAVDARGIVRGVASFAVHALEPPFVPMCRALIGRFALDEATDAPPLVSALVGLGCRNAAAEGAPYMEITDLSAPGTDLYNAAILTGAAPWSRIVARPA